MIQRAEAAGRAQAAAIVVRATELWTASNGLPDSEGTQAREALSELLKVLSLPFEQPEVAAHSNWFESFCAFAATVRDRSSFDDHAETLLSTIRNAFEKHEPNFKAWSELPW